MGHEKILKLLKRYGADVDASLPNGATPMLAAIQEGKAGIVQILIELDADPHRTDARGNAPLHYAAQFGDLGAAHALLQAGVEANVKSLAEPRLQRFLGMQPQGFWVAPLSFRAHWGKGIMIC